MPGTYQLGDRVKHPAKPEWGVGEVLSAQAVRDNGAASQRLQIRFDRAGLKTICTAFVTLLPAAPGEVGPEPASRGPASGPGGGGVDPFAAADNADVMKRMTTLDERAIDPFSTAAQRLAATLSLYRFTSTGGSLLDWAAAQSGLTDPLSRFSRHELEQMFGRWEVLRDQHLGKVEREARVADPEATTRALAAGPETARRALQRNIRRS
jgi:hypothetical protein